MKAIFLILFLIAPALHAEYHTINQGDVLSIKDIKAFQKMQVPTSMDTSEATITLRNGTSFKVGARQIGQNVSVKCNPGTSTCFTIENPDYVSPSKNLSSILTAISTANFGNIDYDPEIQKCFKSMVTLTVPQDHYDTVLNKTRIVVACP